MVRTAARALIVTVAVASAVGLVGRLTAADLTPPKSIEEIMKKGHNKTKGLLAGIGKATEAGDWDTAKDQAAVLKLFGQTLGKFEPHEGTAESWAKFCKEYETQTAAVAAAADKEDAKATGAALKTLGTNCKGCHDAHQ